MKRLMTGLFALGFLAFWAVVAVLFWQATEPYRVLVADLWELIPPGARHETGLGLAIAGGVLLILLYVIGMTSTDPPAPRAARADRPEVGVDLDGGDIDVAGM